MAHALGVKVCVCPDNTLLSGVSASEEVARAASIPGMTRELTVRYLRPTPVGIELHFVARLDRSEGRRLYVSAEVEAEGVRTAEASGLFLAVGGAKFEQLAQARRERQEG